MFDERTQQIVMKAAYDDTLATPLERRRLRNYVKFGMSASDMVISASETARILGVHISNISRMVHKGKLKRGVKGNKKKGRISLASLERLIGKGDSDRMTKRILRNARND